MTNSRQVNKYGWIIIPEDDELVITKNISATNIDLQESLSAEDWGDIQQGDIVFCKAEIQHVGEECKRRPMLVLFKTGPVDHPQIKGFQITTQGPTEGFRGKFKSPLNDWQEEGLNRLSYVNYDHFVDNIDDDIAEHFPNPIWITPDDAHLLAENIKKNYNDLIKVSYSRITLGVELLDRAIKFLENY